MAIDFGGLATTDNYSTAYTPKINEAVKALAYMLDPAYASYTGTPFNNAKRFNGGALEKFNGSSWVAQPLAGGYNGTVGATTPSTGAFTTLSATGVVRFDGASGNGVHFYNGATLLADLYDDGTAWRFQNRSGAPRNWDFYVADVLRASVSSTGLAVTGALSASGVISNTGGSIAISGGTNPYLSLNDGTGIGYVQVYFGNIDITPRAGKYITLSAPTYVNGALSATNGLTVSNGYGVFNGGAIHLTQPTGVQYVLLGNQDSVGTNTPLILRSFNAQLDIGTGTAWSGIGGTYTGIASFSSTGLAVTGSVVASASDSYTGGYGFTGFTDYRIWASANNLNFRIGGAGTTFQVTNNGAAVIGTLTTSKRAYTTSSSVAFSATPTFDASASNFHILGALTANVTSVTLSNAQEGQFLTIRFTQDGTGGRTITTGNMGATNAPSITGSPTTTANKASYLNLTYNATAARWEGSWLGTV